MSDPTTPAAPAADATQAPAPAPAAPQSAAPATPPPYVNPYANRAPARPASASAQPAAAQPPAAPAAVPAEPASAPAADPRVDGLLAVLKRTVDTDMAALPEPVQKAVRDIGGDDPVRLRGAIDALRTHGVVSSSTPAPQTIAPPATTINAPPNVAPEVRTQEGADADVLRRYEEYKREGNHYLASQFFLGNAQAITRAQSRKSLS